MKLTGDDRRLLATLGSEPRDAHALAADLEASPAGLADRLDELADNGLVVALDDDRYRRTESGRRLLRTGGGRMDEAIDTDPAVEAAIAGADLGPDVADAVRAAFAFLRYWGTATVDELVDAIYPEWPAGFDAVDGWWAAVGDALVELPDVESPPDSAGSSSDATLATWRFAGTAEVTTPDADGFLPSERRGHHTYGSVRHAVEALDLSTAEREDLRTAFGVLRRNGSATTAELAGAAGAATNAASSDATADDGRIAELLENHLDALPGVDGDGDRWCYALPPAE